MAKVATNVEKLKAFDAVLAEMNKQFKSETGTLIAKLGDKPQKVETISSGSLVLDSILGGGFGKGRLVELFGAESSGKTTFALTAAADVQKNGGTVAFIDFENALDPSYAAKLGVDVPNLALAQPDYAEQGLDLVDRLAASGVVDLIIVDSVAALVPLSELEGSMEQQSIGLIARLLSKSLRKLVGTANKNGCTVILINQTRDAIGGFSPVGTPQTTTGGRALRFYASQRVEIKGGQQITEGKDNVIGRQTKFVVKKNKIAPPFMKGETVITFGKGINRAAEMIEVGPAYGVIDRPNSRTYVDTTTGEVLGTSKAAALETLEQNPEIYERLASALQRGLTDEISTGEFHDKDALTEEKPSSEDE